MGDRTRAVVRAGYDRAGQAYLDARPGDGDDVTLLDELTAQLAPGARVLDAGCGAGLPIAALLVSWGARVVGLDLSRRQLELCRTTTRQLAPVQGDLAALPIGDARVDALVSFYAVIHVPRGEHEEVFREFWRVLRPGGHALLCLGARDLVEDHDPSSWLGTPMFWSHFDAETNLRLLDRVGFAVQWARLVDDPMDHGQHLFVLATRT